MKWEFCLSVSPFGIHVMTPNLSDSDISLVANAQFIVRSDNFSFQNNGIKKCTCWKTMRFLENNGFLKQ